MKQYNKINNLVGWLTFLVAAFTYCSTIEPTASFWDCPEFITTGYKLEVGHPPGAPFFMLTANLFSQFVSDPSQVARMVNTMSALMSAACIMFLFWSVTCLAKKLVCPDDEKMTLGKLITIMGSGVVGALAYTWSDTFWFSAVEGEVYAYSSLFTAVVFWLILKWENRANEAHSDRWLILIAYLTGLSIGVHLLNLLCIPAIVLVYYYKKNPNADLKGSLIALTGSMVLVGVVLYGIVPGIVKVGGWFELLFVNTLGCPFNTGLVFYIIILAASLIWGVYESYTLRSNKLMNISFLLTVALLGIPFYSYGWTSVLVGIVVLAALAAYLFLDLPAKWRVSARTLNTSLLCMMMIVVGYSSYAVIVIRSAANTPMDQNSPEDIFTLGEYLNREQYGTRPLFYGQAYSSKVALKEVDGGCMYDVREGAPVYQRKEKENLSEKDSYEKVRNKTEYKYAQNMLFPRMYSDAHAKAYEDWLGGIEGKTVPFNQCGEMVMVKMPTQWENIKFFFIYQVNFMYWRYFMWNFAGRQNDLQGSGEPEHGNWITGISFIDNWMLGDQSKMPSDLKANKGHNVFYCLPLILGLVGLFWQAWRGRRGIRQFWVVFFLFFMTGLAIVLYLNQTPQQPRERDYAYAGSFYAYAIWCGLGVLAIYDLLKKKLKGNDVAVAAVVGVACLAVPVQMASQTWDDHDRSGRYTCRDFGQNYLNTLQDKGNPIIFTNGDNDTFPLWYNQEVEGVRTDARVCNLSYLQTDWYIDQMKRPAYDSPSVPITWPRIDFCSGTNDYVEVNPSLKQQVLSFYAEHPKEAAEQFGSSPFELKNIMKYWVRSKDADMHVIPTDTVYITIDKDAVRRSGMMMASDTIPDRMVISLAGKRALYKNDLMMLEMLAECNWKRPLYVATTVGSDNYMNLGDNFVQEGLAYRITPFTTRNPGVRNFDTEKTYNNVMNRFKFGGLETPGLYIDETVMRMCLTHRHLFAQLALELIAEGKNDKALKVLRKAEKVLPEYNIPLSFMSGAPDIAKAYALLGKKADAKRVLDKVWNREKEYADYYIQQTGSRFDMCQDSMMRQMYILKNISDITSLFDVKSAKKRMDAVDKYYSIYQSKGGAIYEGQ